MNDDYLWDRTGEPDPEIQELEEILGTLRHQPEPLAIPAQLQLVQKQSHVGRLAIAAAITIMIFGVGWWVLLTSRRNADSASVPPTPTATDRAPGSPVEAVKETAQAIKPPTNDNGAQPGGQRTRQTMLARNVLRPRRRVVRASEAIARERREAEAAKEQLFLALRVASAKLSLAQKRTQGTYPANMIRNQHKVG